MLTSTKADLWPQTIHGYKLSLCIGILATVMDGATSLFAMLWKTSSFVLDATLRFIRPFPNLQIIFQYFSFIPYIRWVTWIFPKLFANPDESCPSMGSCEYETLFPSVISIFQHPTTVGIGVMSTHLPNTSTTPPRFLEANTIAIMAMPR